MNNGKRMLDTLSPIEQRNLLSIARQTIINELKIKSSEPQSIQISENLLIKKASFVTLSKFGALRGCVGGLEARLPLVEDVKAHAIAAAFYDYRFPPVTGDELDDINIEISVLSIPKIIVYSNVDSLLSQITPHIDGVVIESSNGRATFLPQVWEKIPDKVMFLDELCRKMGEEPDCWRSSALRVYTYQVEIFHE